MNFLPVYYFRIKEYISNEVKVSGNNRYFGIVKLGPLTSDEVDRIFKVAIQRVIDAIESGSKDKYMSNLLPRFLHVTKLRPDEFGASWSLESFDNNLSTDYDLLSTDELDDTLNWDIMSDSFLRYRYQDSLRQLGQTDGNIPTNDAILATAFRAVELIRQKPLSVEHASSALSTEDTFDSDNPSMTLESTQKNKGRGIIASIKNLEGSIDRSLTKLERHLSDTQLSTEVQEQRTSSPSAERKDENLGATDLGSDATAFLEKMQGLGTPQCGNKGDENWAHCSEVAKRHGTTTENLRQDRIKGNKVSKTMGVDKQGRAWRARGVQTDTFYLRISVGLPLLTENSELPKEKS